MKNFLQDFLLRKNYWIFYGHLPDKVSTCGPPDGEGSSVAPEEELNNKDGATPLPDEKRGTRVKTDKEGKIQPVPKRIFINQDMLWE